MSIPSALEFPLSGQEYADLCTQAEDLSRHVEITASIGDQSPSLFRGYYEIDPNYLDVKSARIAHLLPSDLLSQDIVTDGSYACPRSMTFVLDEEDSALGKTLINLWLAYGLAQREERAFFIDDTRFAYGKYDELFTMSPNPKCRRPFPSQLVPYPRQADHLIVGTSTSKWLFGETFYEHFTLNEIYDMAREGYEALFHMRSDDNEYVGKRLEELRNDKSHVIGVHLRRGDRHPWEHQYEQSYLPPGRYTSAIHDIKDGLESSVRGSAMVILASDDPDMYSHPEIVRAGPQRAQKRISLASRHQLGAAGGLGFEGGFFRDQFRHIGLEDHTSNSPKKYTELGSPMPNFIKPGNTIANSETNAGIRKKVDVISGEDAVAPARRDIWDSPVPIDQKETTKPTHLGSTTPEDQLESTSEVSSPSQPASTKPQISPQSLHLRQFIARSYLLDLAVLGRASDSIVCTVSSSTCRVLAVMMGREKAFGSDSRGKDLVRTTELSQGLDEDKGIRQGKELKKRSFEIDSELGSGTDHTMEEEQIETRQSKRPGWINIDAPSVYGWRAVDF